MPSLHPRAHARATGFVVVVIALGLGCGSARAADGTPAPGPEVRAWQTGWIAPDKLEHASLAFTSALALGLVTRRPAIAFGGAFTLGFAKELWDRRTTRFDPADLAADTVGAGLGALAATALDR